MACGRGELFGAGNAQLPLPPMLMFDRITSIGQEGGAHGKGHVLAEFDIRPDLWFFPCHFQGDPVRVTIRFSNGAGDPRCSDAAVNDPRGMAVKFYLPDGSRTDLALQTWPVFPAATPEEFHGLMKAQATGEEATAAFLAEHPRRNMWVGVSTAYTIIGERLAPWLADLYLAKTGVSGQQTGKELPRHGSNVFEARDADGDRAGPVAHGFCYAGGLSTSGN